MPGLKQAGSVTLNPQPLGLQAIKGIVKFVALGQATAPWPLDTAPPLFTGQQQKNVVRTRASALTLLTAVSRTICNVMSRDNGMWRSNCDHVRRLPGSEATPQHPLTYPCTQQRPTTDEGPMLSSEPAS